MTEALLPELAPQFPGDANHTLRLLQESARGALLPWLYIAARDRYLDAVRIVGVETPLALRIMPLRPVDLTGLHGVYDLVARRFRYEFDPAGQPPLPFVADDYEAYAGKAWREWWFRRIGDLVQDEFIVRAVLAVVAGEEEDASHLMRQEVESLVEGREELHQRAASWDEAESDRATW